MIKYGTFRIMQRLGEIISVKMNRRMDKIPVIWTATPLKEMWINEITPKFCSLYPLSTKSVKHTTSCKRRKLTVSGY